MALLRLIRTEAFRLVMMGFALGSAGVMLTQPVQAQHTDSTSASTLESAR